MALKWLHAARYADSHGYQVDASRANWPWRDWVIDAFNHNMSFDQFTIEQLAGDMLPDATTEQIVATGFNRNHRLNNEGGIIPEEWRVETVIDRVETTGQTWLGLSVGCARCHDHKYDPLSQREFYGLFAIFTHAPESGIGNESGGNIPPVTLVMTPEQAEESSRRDAAVAAAERSVRAERARIDERGAAGEKTLPALREHRQGHVPPFRGWIVARRGADAEPPGWAAENVLKGDRAKGRGVKRFIRQLVISTVYRQSSRLRGLLMPTIGGPSVRPWMPDGVWDETSTYSDLRGYKPDTRQDRYRRTMCTVWRRTAGPPTMLLFDAPGREIRAVRRSRTNTPLQALALLNEMTFVETANGLARRMVAEGKADPGERIDRGFRLAVGLVREPDGVGDDEFAAYALTANVLLNLDEFAIRD